MAKVDTSNRLKILKEQQKLLATTRQRVEEAWYGQNGEQTSHYVDALQKLLEEERKVATEIERLEYESKL